MIDALAPYEPRPMLIGLFALVALVYTRGLLRRGRRTDSVSAALFYIGLIGLYLFTQTQLDYLSRYVFFVHRIQHLVLHHVSPFLIALSMPAPVLAAGLPGPVRRTLARLAGQPLCRALYRVIQQPAIAGLVFVGLIAFWLWPPVHFHAMLSNRAYWAMNLSMIVDGLLFWWLILDPRMPGASPTTQPIATRLIVLWAVMIGQILIAAPIALADHELFTAYSICGRALSISPLTDQQLGGLITWIPPAMMSVIGTLVLMSLGFRQARSRASET